MKKIGVLILIFLVGLVAVSAANESITTEEKAYDCLKNKVDDCKDLSVEELSFSLLALAYYSDIQSDCKTELFSKSRDKKCWPESSCNIKDTSLALLALNNINSNTEDIEDWLLDKKIRPGLIWYLQIDANEATTCKISYSGKSYEIEIDENKKINKNPGDCLAKAREDYWLKISDKCLEKKYEITCDRSFKSNLIYQRQGSDVYYVSSDTESASASGKTEHEINVSCLADSGTCNYEANLWAVFALSKAGQDISEFLPYLKAYGEDNQEFFPSAFLYLLTGSNEFYNEMNALQSLDGFWLVSTNKYYDTALALLSMQEMSSDYLNLGKSWLEESQDDDGCWNSDVRDTAFLLWAVFPKDATISEGVEYCEDFKYYCAKYVECIDSGGEILDNYHCLGGKICCSVEPQLKSCSELGGKKCAAGETCSGTESPSSDGVCCIGVCEEKPSPTFTQCEINGGYCKISCEEGEEEVAYSCDGYKTCCKVKSGGYWWIWILLILIFLVVLGIIFRKRLLVLIHNIKSKPTKTPPPATTRQFPFPRQPPAYPTQRRILPKRELPVKRPAPRKSTIDSELEKTFKKLREMSK